MKQTNTFLERLADGPVNGDGAMGTYLHELGHDIRRGTQTLVLRDPDLAARWGPLTEQFERSYLAMP